MALSSVRDVLEICSPKAAARHECGNHPGQPAWGICSQCGRDLCGDCFVYFQRYGFCPRCPERAAAVVKRLRPWASNPAVIFVGLIVFFSAVYVLFGGSAVDASVDADEKAAARAIARRNCFYIGKAVRLKVYADYLSRRGKERLAARSFNRARSALEEVLDGTTTQSTEQADLARKAGLLMCIADCYRGEGKTAEALDALREALDTRGPSETTGLVCYRLGRLYEEDMEKYEEAVSMYKRAQDYKVEFTRFVDGIFEALEKPADEGRLDAAVGQLAGSYDRAEAQYRVVLCFEKMGLPQKTKEAQRTLVNEYPYSEFAREITKTTDIKPAFGGFSPFRDKVKTSATPDKEKEEERETLTIVPLEE